MADFTSKRGRAAPRRLRLSAGWGPKAGFGALAGAFTFGGALAYLDAGLRATVWENATLAAEYGVLFADGDGEVHTGPGSLKIPLGTSDDGIDK